MISKSTSRQILSSATVLLASFVVGCQKGYVEKLNSSPKILLEIVCRTEFKLFRTIMYSGSIVTVFLCFTSGHVVGRKVIVLGCALVFTGSWFLLLVNPSSNTILACLFVDGIASDLLAIIGNLYCSEIASPNNREIFAVSYNIAMAAGRTAELAVGIYANHLLLIVFPLAAAVLACLMSAFMVETPYYLVSIGLQDKAMDKLCWLNNRSEHQRPTSYLRNVQRYVIEERDKRSSLCTQLCTINDLKLILVMMAVKGTSRMTSTLFMRHELFTELLTLHFGLNTDTSLCAYNCMIFIFDGLGFFTVRSFSRRSLLIWGLCVTAVLQLLLSYSTFLDADGMHKVSTTTIVALILTASLSLVFAATYHAVLVILIVEIFPYGLKEFYTSLLALSSDTLTVALFTAYEKYENTLSLSFWLAINAYGSLFGAICVFFFITETRGKSLYHIRTAYKFHRGSTIEADHSSDTAKPVPATAVVAASDESGDESDSGLRHTTPLPNQSLTELLEVEAVPSSSSAETDFELKEPAVRHPDTAFKALDANLNSNGEFT